MYKPIYSHNHTKGRLYTFKQFAEINLKTESMLILWKKKSLVPFLFAIGCSLGLTLTQKSKIITNKMSLPN